MKQRPDIVLIPTFSLTDQARALTDFERAQLGLWDLGLLRVSNTNWSELYEVLACQPGRDSEFSYAGFCMISKHLTIQTITMECLFIHPDWRRCGVGARVLASLIEKTFKAWNMERFETQAYDIADSHRLYKTYLHEEGVKRSVGVWDGKRHNLTYYGLLKSEHQKALDALRSKYGTEQRGTTES